MNPRSVRHDSGQQTLARSLAKQDNPRRLTECERACKTRGTEKRWREPSARRVQRGRGAVPGLLTLVPKHLSSAVQRPLELVLVVRHHLDFDDINCTAGETARGDQRNFSQSSSYGRPSLTRSRDCRRGQARHSGGCKVRREAFRKCVWKLVHQAACGRTGRRGGFSRGAHGRVRQAQTVAAYKCLDWSYVPSWALVRMPARIVVGPTARYKPRRPPSLCQMVATWCAREPVALGVCIRTFSCEIPRYGKPQQWFESGASFTGAYQICRIRHRRADHPAHQPPAQLDRHPAPSPVSVPRTDRAHPRQNGRFSRVVPSHPYSRIRSLPHERGRQALVDRARALGREQSAERRPPGFRGGGGCRGHVRELLADFDSGREAQGGYRGEVDQRSVGGGLEGWHAA